jgi:hypothetical protein
MVTKKDFTFLGPEIDDLELLERLPRDLQQLLTKQNGCIMFNGGLHIRGASTSPIWHSIREAWFGKRAFHKYYKKVKKSDVPFAQDSVGDQFLLRDQKVIRLSAEDGNVVPTHLTLEDFLEASEENPVDFLGLQPLQQFTANGKSLVPGYLLLAYPPFCAIESASGVKLSAVPADELLKFHIDLSKKMAILKSNQKLRIKVI